MNCLICGAAHTKCGGPATLLGIPVGAEGPKQMINGMWTADRRVFLDANGKAVGEKDPSKVELLIAPGQQMEMAKAVALGLVKLPEPKAEKATATKAEKQASDKAVAPDKNK